MSTSSQITIVIIRAAGYSGATWFNLVLGSHENALAMGPPQRILDLPKEESASACFAHRAECPFWPPFLKDDRHRGRFFRDLADFSGKRLFVVNYPPKDLVEREIAGKGFRVLHIKLVRDGRANLFSYLRHKYPSGGISALRGILEWQIPKWDQVDRKMSVDESARMAVRYEDVVLKPQEALVRIGRFLDMDYPPNAHRFWEFSHHPTAGNGGVLDTLCRMQGLPGHYHQRKVAYDDVTAMLRRDPDRPFLDSDWQTGLSHEDRLAFDCLLGGRNSAHGYERDRFSAEERACFERDYENRAAQAWLEVPKKVQLRSNDARSATRAWWLSGLRDRFARRRTPTS